MYRCSSNARVTGITLYLTAISSTSSNQKSVWQTNNDITGEPLKTSSTEPLQHQCKRITESLHRRSESVSENTCRGAQTGNFKMHVKFPNTQITFWMMCVSIRSSCVFSLWACTPIPYWWIHSGEEHCSQINLNDCWSTLGLHAIS